MEFMNIVSKKTYEKDGQEKAIWLQCGTLRKNISIGAEVAIVLKEDQRSGNLTEGIVSRILTNVNST